MTKLRDLQVEANRIVATEIVAASGVFTEGQIPELVFLKHIRKIVAFATVPDNVPDAQLRGSPL